MINLFEKTNYPKIFEGTYWGYFKYDDEFKNIIDNRNMFIDTYNIKSYKRRTIKINEFIRNEKKCLKLDHTETYKTHTNLTIIITSPYKHISIEEFESKGWIRISPLYSNNAITFMKYI